MTLTASDIVTTDTGAQVQLVPATLDAEWVAQIITTFGPVTVANVVEYSGRSETTVRKLLKSLVADGTLWANTENKPVTYELITETAYDDGDDEDELEPEELEDEVKVDAEAKIDDIMAAITAEPQPEPEPEPQPAKTKKSKKVAHTTVPDKHNEHVIVNGNEVWVTDAYALLTEPVTFTDALEAYGWANTAIDRGEGDHTAAEIAGLYYATVADYIARLYHDGQLTQSVWYGRTFRLRRTLIGNGKGTAAGRPDKTVTTGE